MRFMGTRATDSKLNTHVVLSRSAAIKKETTIQIKKGRLLEVAREFKSSTGDEWTLTREERDGLKSLVMRTKEGELVVIETDKSGKFTVMSQDDFLEAGESMS